MTDAADARVTLRLPPDLKADLEDLARATHRSLNATIVVILERALRLDPLLDSL